VIDWPDFSALGSVPWGLVLGAVTVFGFLRKKSGHRDAQRGFPRLAERLGLTFKASSYQSGIGKMSGQVRGYAVVVDPDDQRVIRVQLPHPVGLDLSLEERTQRTRSGYEPFRPETRGAFRRLARAYGSQEGIGRLHTARSSPDVEALLEARELRTFLVTEESIVMGFDFGSPPFLPVALVERAVPILVSWAEELSPTLPS
jgi:hypothetical protein